MLFCMMFRRANHSRAFIEEMNEENSEKCPCGKKIYEHNLKKHRDFCYPFKSSISQPKLIRIKKFSSKNNCRKI